MAILFTQDGMDQHYDTYEEFEKAMILMKRLNGEEVPKDLLDEVKERDSEALEKERLTDFIVGKAKDGGMHEIVLAQGKPITFRGIKGDEISVGDYVVAKDSNTYGITNDAALLKVSHINDSYPKSFDGLIIEHKDMPKESGEIYTELDINNFVKLSDNEEEARELFNKEYDKEDKSSELKFKVGDKVRVVDNSTFGLEEGSVATVVEIDSFDDGVTYLISKEESISFYHRESDLELVEDDEETDLELLELSVDEIKVGDKVKVVSAEDGTDSPYHSFTEGSIVEVEEVYGNGRVYAYDGTFHQTLLSNHYEKVESLGKDANGEDLYKGDVVTGTEDNYYIYTNSTVDMEVLGKGSHCLHEEANILVRILGESGAYVVDSSKFIKLTDNPDEAKEKFSEIIEEGEDELLPVGAKVRILRPSVCGDLDVGDVGEITETDAGCSMGLVYSVRVRGGEEGYGWLSKEDVEVVEEESEFKVGDKVKVIGNYAGHCLEVGEVRRIKEVNSYEPKYNLSENPHGRWANTEDIEIVTDSEEFRAGDIVYVTETIENPYNKHSVQKGLAEIKNGFVFKDSLICQEGVVINFKTDDIDHRDKVRLVCRAEDRKDKDYDDK